MLYFCCRTNIKNGPLPLGERLQFLPLLVGQRSHFTSIMEMATLYCVHFRVWSASLMERLPVFVILCFYVEDCALCPECCVCPVFNKFMPRVSTVLCLSCFQQVSSFCFEQEVPPPRSNWRAQHEDFINTVRAARGVSKALAEGGPLPPPPPPSINPGQCLCHSVYNKCLSVCDTCLSATSVCLCNKCVSAISICLSVTSVCL